MDGAKAAKPVNTKKVIEVVNSTRLKVEVGGGIRTMETVENYLEQGVSRVILGSSAINEPEFVKQAVQKYGEMCIRDRFSTLQTTKILIILPHISTSIPYTIRSVNLTSSDTMFRPFTGIWRNIRESR